MDNFKIILKENKTSSRSTRYPFNSFHRHRVEFDAKKLLPNLFELICSLFLQYEIKYTEFMFKPGT